MEIKVDPPADDIPANTNNVAVSGKDLLRYKRFKVSY